MHTVSIAPCKQGCHTQVAETCVQAIEWFGSVKTADDMYRLAFT
jgi:hypothetical protein